VERRLAKVFVFVGIVMTTFLAFSEPSAKVETMTGRIVAYSGGVMCLNGNALWSMLIHVQDHTSDVTSEFVEVQFSLPCGKSPDWLTRKSSLRKFQLTRDQQGDSVLKEFVDCVTEPPSGAPDKICPPFPLWKHLRGAEHENLPFGQHVPSYRSVNLPLVPVV